MTSNFLKTGFVALLGWSLIGCAAKFKGTSDDDQLGRLTEKKNNFMKEGILAEVAVAKSKDLQTGINKVELEARAKLTRAVETKTSTMQKQFKEEVGNEFLDHFTQVSKSVASTVLTGTTVLETPYREKKGMFEVYGIIVMDPKAFKEALAEQLAANQAMKTRWLASKGYADLEKEAAAFEKFKKDMATPAGEAPTAAQPAEAKAAE